MSIKEQNFKMALRAMWFLLKENVAFVKYEELINMLSEVGACQKKTELPGNAHMRSKHLQSELIGALGM